MIYVLLLFLILGAFITYLMNGRNILSAGLISHFMYILSVAVVIVSMDYFDTNISFKTVLVILAALFFWGCGELTAMYSSKLIMPVAENKARNTDGPILVGKGIIFVICTFMFLIFVFRFRDIYIISLQAGNPGDLFKTIQYARIYMSLVPNGYSMGVILSQAIVLSECLTYFLVYVYFYNKFFHGIKNRMLLFPALLYALQLLCSTGRTAYIELITIILIISFIMLKEKTNWTRTNDGKIIRSGVIAIISFLILFRLFGYLTETSLHNELWNNFSEYIGASIIGLDQYLGSPPTKNILFGQETLRNIYMIMREWGLNIAWYSPHHTFYYWANGESNVYTGLRKCIQDYTLVGMFITRYLLGFLYAVMIKRIKHNRVSNNPSYAYIVCGMLFYPIAMTAIADVYTAIISTETLYELLYLFFIHWFFIGRKHRRLRIRTKLIAVQS